MSSNIWLNKIARQKEESRKIVKEIESFGAELIHDYDESVTIYFGDLLEKKDVMSLPNLKWIHFPSVGVNRALIPEVINSDIIVTNSKGLFNKSVTSELKSTSSTVHVFFIASLYIS